MNELSMTKKAKARRRRLAKAAGLRNAVMYRTTPPLTLDDVFGLPGGTSTGKGKRLPLDADEPFPKRQRTPGAFGRDKCRMVRVGAEPRGDRKRDGGDTDA